MSEIKLNTYKSVWFEDKATGNYTRQQKQKYFLEPIVNMCLPLLKLLPKGKRLQGLLGKNSQGVDFYRYYEDVLKSKERGKWGSELSQINSRLKDIGITLNEKCILDISGEPGFFW